MGMLAISGKSIDKPTITSPLNTAAGVSTIPTITSSAYIINGPVGSHLNSDWEIATDAAFTTGLITNSANAANKTSWTLSTALTIGTKYWVRVRYRSNDGTPVISDWSDGVEFTTRSMAFASGGGSTFGISAAAYNFSSGVATRVADPAIWTTGSGSTAIQFSRDGAYILVSTTNAPTINAYEWSNAFGSKLADPSPWPGGFVTRITFSNTGSHVVLGNQTTPFIHAYAWAGGFGTKLADPITILPGTANGIAFSPDGNFIAIAHAVTPFISVYNWAGGFGTKIADPATLPTGIGRDITFSPDGKFIAIGHTAAPTVTVYNWSAAGFGTKIADPSPTTASTACVGVRFSPGGTHIAYLGTTSSAALNIYPWSAAGFGVRMADPIDPTPAAGVTLGGLEFSPDGKWLLRVRGATSPAWEMFEWSNATGIGNRLTITGWQANAGRSVAWSPVY